MHLVVRVSTLRLYRTLGQASIKSKLTTPTSTIEASLHLPFPGTHGTVYLQLIVQLPLLAVSGKI
ncbi:hypothetical protein JYU34_002420 [Plutella xylostella]|uniref:Uncharacterized protein n=1 Tax=Plutella xylostella TaxID=51655 RepID=A0ABQ7R248_PLUXY|nr:hypothetical protein JYU34_002420 [Plutella xylostella]